MADFLRLLATVPPESPRLQPEALAMLVAEILSFVPDMEGPMPAGVAAFVRQHGAPAS
ncbi:MAG TPA: hypothetical protein VFS08_06960 [Gemmatimonadaceae bacterium]|nr:hypothetical protein [Gemmatimonadaceae bacterium]